MLKRSLFILMALSLVMGCGSKKTASIDDKPPAVGDDVIYPYGPESVGSSSTTFYEGKIERIDGPRATVRDMEIRQGSSYPATSTREVEVARLYKIPKAGSETEVNIGDIVVAKHEGKSSSLMVWYAGEVIRINEYGIQLKNFSQPDDLWFVDADELVRPTKQNIAGFKRYAELSAFRKEAKKHRPVKPEGYMPQKGDEVIAEGLSEFWHAGRILQVTGAIIDVAWEDSSTKLEGTVYTVIPRPTADESPAPAAGQYLLVKPTSGGNWLYAQVTKVDGRSAEVKVEDGTTRTVSPGEFWPLQ